MQGAGLQMGSRPSKDGNDAMSMYTISETDSDYLRQATLKEVDNLKWQVNPYR